MDAEANSERHLSDARIDALWREATTNHGDLTRDFVRWFARAIESETARNPAPSGFNHQ